MSRHSWTYLTNHGHVLVCLARDPNMSLRQLSTEIGITERAVLLIIADLEAASVVTRRRVGRRNHYTICRDTGMRHPLLDGVTLGDLLEPLEAPESGPRLASAGSEPA
ncbi:MAG TPA: winged helix-turn-helix domain-containing protein [Segeticoccus sp.]|nr:winged helix-turn-helix domain-containing protein [Segeticoccus sp.]